jgi:soluble lytic murein transglycosylase-like protein
MGLWLSLCSPASADLHDTTYDHLFHSQARAHLPGYDWYWIKAQSWQESRFNPAAVSPVGATGLMQIMPGTGRDLARRTGVSGPLTSPTISVLYGTVYMKQMMHIWRAPRTALERLFLALASYNAGAGNVIKAQTISGGERTWKLIAPFLVQVTGRHSQETLGYVRLIRKWYKELTEERTNGRTSDYRCWGWHVRPWGTNCRLGQENLG